MTSTESHPGGFLLVDKPAGITSHDAVQKVRRSLGTRRVGHCGTLDPMATGLLVVAVGPATRLLQFLEGFDKAYSGEVVLGSATDTEDAEGRVVAWQPVPELSEDRVGRELAALVGSLRQQAPAYSAVRVGGERLYKKARRQEEVERPWRTVHVHGLELTALKPPRLGIWARVSKGTYIRSLAVEIGRRLGTLAHLGALRRTQVGPFHVEQAVSVDSLHWDQVRSPLDVMDDWPRRTLTESELWDVAHGRPLMSHRSSPAGPVLLATPKGELAAVAEETQGRLKYRCVLVKPDRLSS